LFAHVGMTTPKDKQVAYVVLGLIDQGRVLARLWSLATLQIHLVPEALRAPLLTIANHALTYHKGKPDLKTSPEFTQVEKVP